MDVIKTALNALPTQRSSVTKEEITTVIQFCKEHSEMKEAKVVSRLASRFDVVQAPIRRIVKHFRQYSGLWGDYVLPTLEEINTPVAEPTDQRRPLEWVWHQT
ncbi:hypothetical protein FRB93_005923 [Tulasnella sp. JGI-2019a]|nr:hypothetical protein FRB93_005923 [Tulasnella sp. JGI-2019a]